MLDPRCKAANGRRGSPNGALVASTLACAFPGRFAAVGPVAGIPTPPNCETGPIPVITFHGTADQ